MALRIICDREDEINAFIPEEYWTLDAKLKVAGEKKVLSAKYVGNESGKVAINSEDQMKKLLKKLDKAKNIRFRM